MRRLMLHCAFSAKGSGENDSPLLYCCGIQEIRKALQHQVARKCWTQMQSYRQEWSSKLEEARKCLLLRFSDCFAFDVPSFLSCGSFTDWQKAEFRWPRFVLRSEDATWVRQRGSCARTAWSLGMCRPRSGSGESEAVSNMCVLRCALQRRQFATPASCQLHLLAQAQSILILVAACMMLIID